MSTVSPRSSSRASTPMDLPRSRTSPHRLGLELLRERPSFPLSHGLLLSHFRAIWGVHETGAGSPSPARAELRHFHHGLSRSAAPRPTRCALDGPYRARPARQRSTSPLRRTANTSWDSTKYIAKPWSIPRTPNGMARLPPTHGRGMGKAVSSATRVTRATFQAQCYNPIVRHTPDGFIRQCCELPHHMESSNTRRQALTECSVRDGHSITAQPG